MGEGQKQNKNSMKTIETTLEVRIKRSKETPKLVHFGKAGHTTHFAKLNGTSSREQGYDDPDRFFAPSKWWAHDYMEQRDIAQYEGCAWIDVREAVDTDAGYSWVFKGPLVDVDLANGEIDPCPQPSELMATAMISDPGNAFGRLLVMQGSSRIRKEKAGPLDSVSVSEYLRLWKEHGATVGVICNGQFVAQ